MKLIDLSELSRLPSFELIESNRAVLADRSNQLTFCCHLADSLNYSLDTSAVSCLLLNRYWLNCPEDPSEALIPAAVGLAAKIVEPQNLVELRATLELRKRLLGLETFESEDQDFREKVVFSETKLFKFNSAETEIPVAFGILDRLHKVIKHASKDEIIASSAIFAMDIYKSPYCVCFPPANIAASAFLSALTLPKITLSAKDLSIDIETEDKKGEALRGEGFNQKFPWKALFGVEYPKVKQLAELHFTYLAYLKR